MLYSIVLFHNGLQRCASFSFACCTPVYHPPCERRVLAEHNGAQLRARLLRRRRWRAHSRIETAAHKRPGASGMASHSRRREGAWQSLPLNVGRCNLFNFIRRRGLRGRRGRVAPWVSGRGLKTSAAATVTRVYAGRSRTDQLARRARRGALRSLVARLAASAHHVACSLLPAVCSSVHAALFFCTPSKKEMMFASVRHTLA